MTSVEYLAKLPPDAIAQVVNAWRDAWEDTPTGADCYERAAQAFRAALASVLPQFGDVPVTHITWDAEGNRVVAPLGVAPPEPHGLAEISRKQLEAELARPALTDAQRIEWLVMVCVETQQALMEALGASRAGAPGAPATTVHALAARVKRIVTASPERCSGETCGVCDAGRALDRLVDLALWAASSDDRALRNKLQRVVDSGRPLDALTAAEILTLAGAAPR